LASGVEPRLVLHATTLLLCLPLRLHGWRMALALGEPHPPSARHISLARYVQWQRSDPGWSAALQPAWEDTPRGEYLPLRSAHRAQDGQQGRLFEWRESVLR